MTRQTQIELSVVSSILKIITATIIIILLSVSVFAQTKDCTSNEKDCVKKQWSGSPTRVMPYEPWWPDPSAQQPVVVPKPTPQPPPSRMMTPKLTTPTTKGGR